MYNQNKKNESFVYDVIHNCPELYSLLNSDEIINVVKGLIGDNNSVIIANNYNIRIDLPGEDWTENLPWHQDSPYNNPLYQKKNSIAVWVAVFDVPEEVGPLTIKDCSHKLGQIKPEKVPHGGNYFRKDDFVYKIPDQYLKEEHAEILLPCKQGDVLFFDLDVIHKSGINKSKNLVRWSAQARIHNASKSGFLSKYDY